MRTDPIDQIMEICDSNDEHKIEKIAELIGCKCGKPVVKSMTFDEYQAVALKTAIYPKPELPIIPGNMSQKVGFVYPALGLCGEAGEVAEKCKKLLRDKKGVFNQEDMDMITKELGDVLWYLAAISSEFGIKLNDVAQINAEKLLSRQERGVIKGSGDNR